MKTSSKFGTEACDREGPAPLAKRIVTRKKGVRFMCLVKREDISTAGQSTGAGEQLETKEEARVGKSCGIGTNACWLST